MTRLIALVLIVDAVFIGALFGIAMATADPGKAQAALYWGLFCWVAWSCCFWMMSERQEVTDATV